MATESCYVLVTGKGGGARGGDEKVGIIITRTDEMQTSKIGYKIHNKQQ